MNYICSKAKDCRLIKEFKCGHQTPHKKSIGCNSECYVYGIFNDDNKSHPTCVEQIDYKIDETVFTI